MLNLFMISFTSEEKKILDKVAAAGRELQVKVYVIGGFVRDKLLGRENKDIDVVCVGDGLRLAERVAASFRTPPRVNYFKTYGTAQLKLADMELEFVGARRESYQPASRNPEVSPGSLEDDQKRR